MRGDPLGVPLGAQVGSISYTPTIAWTGNTITTPVGSYTKVPGGLLLWVSFTCSVGGVPGALSISLPGGLTASVTASVGVLLRSATIIVDSVVTAAGSNALGLFAGSSNSPVASNYAAALLIPTTT